MESHPSPEKVRQILLLRQPFFYGSLCFFVLFINPCSLSLMLHIALKLICLVLAQCAMILLWCDPNPVITYYTQKSVTIDTDQLFGKANCKRWRMCLKLLYLLEKVYGVDASVWVLQWLKKRKTDFNAHYLAHKSSQNSNRFSCAQL